MCSSPGSAAFMTTWRSRVSQLASTVCRKAYPGDVKSVGKGVPELRIDYGPGYRLYFTKQDKAIVLLLCGGDKRTQKQDITRAVAMVQELKGK